MNANFDHRSKTEILRNGAQSSVFGHRATESEPVKYNRAEFRSEDQIWNYLRAFVHFVIFCSNSVDRFPSPTIGVYWRNSVKTSDGLLSFRLGSNDRTSASFGSPWCSNLRWLVALIPFGCGSVAYAFSRLNFLGNRKA